jgi:hypothetical protein
MKLGITFEVNPVAFSAEGLRESQMKSEHLCSQPNAASTHLGALGLGG